MTVGFCASFDGTDVPTFAVCVGPDAGRAELAGRVDRLQRAPKRSATQPSFGSISGAGSFRSTTEGSEATGAIECCS